MSTNIFFIAIDVDDKSFHGCGVNKNTGVIKEFACRPTIGHLEKNLNEFLKKSDGVKVCYEATYLGFSLCRALRKKGFDCEVIAPSMIPQRPGDRVKTDRVDCFKMAEYYLNGQLSVVHMPTETEEVTRDLIRARNFLSRQVAALKRHVLSHCRRMGIDYRQGAGRENKNYWTVEHRAWLLTKVNESKEPVFKLNMTLLLDHLNQVETRINLYDEEIERIADGENYQEKVEALCCYRGVSVLTAMTLVTELSDIKRFTHPRQLCSYAGMELIEYSSGGHQRQYRMSKMGNAHIRTSVIEACQTASRLPVVSKKLKVRRKNAKEKYIAIADRCMRRLYTKSKRLLHREKSANKVKVACAREMLCFVWESLKAAA